MSGNKLPGKLPRAARSWRQRPYRWALAASATVIAVAGIAASATAGGTGATGPGTAKVALRPQLVGVLLHTTGHP